MPATNPRYQELYDRANPKRGIAHLEGPLIGILAIAIPVGLGALIAFLTS